MPYPSKNFNIIFVGKVADRYGIILRVVTGTDIFMCAAKEKNTSNSKMIIDVTCLVCIAVLIVLNSWLL